MGVLTCGFKEFSGLLENSEYLKLRKAVKEFTKLI
jgi:hypothetical protein